MVIIYVIGSIMKILIIDDNVEITDVVAMYGKTISIEVDQINDPRLLEGRVEYDYDMVILDVDMPMYNGYEIFKRIKAANDKVVIVFLSAKAQKEDRMKGLQLGADDYILKPLDMDELFIKLINILGRSGIKYVDNFRIDYRNRVIFQDGVEVSLYNKAFEVFSILLSNKDKIVAKEYILREVWGNAEYLDPKTVEVQIRAIRKALGDRIISTVRSEGYVYGTKFSR